MAVRKSAKRLAVRSPRTGSEDTGIDASTNRLVAGIESVVSENRALRARVAELEGFIAAIERALSGRSAVASSPRAVDPVATLRRRRRPATIVKASRANSDPTLLEKRRAAMAKARAALAAKRAAA
jgi:hypothetical protein